MVADPEREEEYNVRGKKWLNIPDLNVKYADVRALSSCLKGRDALPKNAV
jgi:hypothetical protein